MFSKLLLNVCDVGYVYLIRSHFCLLPISVANYIVASPCISGGSYGPMNGFSNVNLCRMGGGAICSIVEFVWQVRGISVSSMIFVSIVLTIIILILLPHLS